MFMTNKSRKFKTLGILFVICLLVISIPCCFMHRYATNSVQRQYRAENTSKEVVYLSNLPYMSNLSRSGWNDFHMDEAGDGNNITIHYENAEWEFEKGIWAHATSTLVYDLQDYGDYINFSAFVGLNKTAYNNSDGVYFTISVSNDLNKWEEKYKSALKKGLDNSDFVQFNLSGYRYLKLYAHMNGGNGSDHSVYADAKLTTKDYKETDFTIKTVAEYDSEIATIPNKNIVENKDYEKLVLQRYLVSEFGEYGLKKFLSESEEHQNTYHWLIDDVDNLRMYIMGGKPDGSYYNSLKVLNKLLNATLKDGKKLIDDFEDQTPTKYQTTTMGELYKKMAITLSLTHSTLVGLWMNPNVVENQSDAVVRYEIYKQLYNEDKFKVSENQDQTKWFEHLEIEEMRYVMNNIIDDEEILWLNAYTQTRIDENPGQEEKYLQPHPYMKYIDPNYNKPEYYAEDMLDHWDTLYGNFHSVYKITYKPGVQKLWMNIDNGAVCGGISKIGSNIRGVHGTPSSVINQPGHAALIYWRENDKGEGYWTIDNDVSNWGNSNKTEKLSVRMPLGWGDESYLSTTKVSEGVVNYVLLAQAALNNYSAYQDSRELYLTAALENDSEKKIAIYEKSLEALPINIDAWYGIIENYKTLNKSDEEYFALAQRIFKALTYYPLPMYHLSEELLDQVNDVTVEYQIVQLRTETLESVSKLEDSKHVQAYAIRVESNYLLGKIDTTLATFSFDGDTANSIVLSDNYENARWDYCLDGASCIPENQNSTVANTHWKEVSSSKIATLEASEVQKINETNDIYVHIVGVNYTDTNLYKIDIQKPGELSLYANDLENRVIGVDGAMEWRIVKENGNALPESAWTSFATASPNLTGNKTVQVRKRATSTYLMSTTVELEYTEDQQTEKEKYVPTAYLTVDDFSTEAAGHDRYAVYAIDGNLNTHWHSDWNGNDKEKYIVLKLKRKMYLTALEYVPRPGSSLNGRVIRAKIETSLDGKDWKEVYLTREDAKWSTDTSIKKATFEATEARYVRFTGVETHGNFITASMLNLYQDASIETDPELEIAYSTVAPTNENVVARAINLEDNMEITAICPTADDSDCIIKRSEEKAKVEEDGTKSEEEITEYLNELMSTYVFTENGTVYFQYHLTDEETDNYYYEEVTVNNIDTEAPEVNIQYTKESATNQDVTAVLHANEPIKVHTGVPIEYDEEGNITPVAPEEDGTYHEKYKTNTHIYTFEENGTFTFEYEDLAGNTGTINADVSWIDRETPYASVDYSTKENTYDFVTATLIPEKDEKIIILNNEGNSIHTFGQNGEFTFIFQDEAGNVGETTAKVNWIMETPQEEQTPNTPAEENKEDNKNIAENTEDTSTNTNDNSEKEEEKEDSSSNKNESPKIQNGVELPQKGSNNQIETIIENQTDKTTEDTTKNETEVRNDAEEEKVENENNEENSSKEKNASILTLGITGILIVVCLFILIKIIVNTKKRMD